MNSFRGEDAVVGVSGGLVLALSALLFSYFVGTTLHDIAHTPLDEMRCINDAFLSLHHHGSSLDYLNQDNFIMVKHGLVVIGLEVVEGTESVERLMLGVQGDISL